MKKSLLNGMLIGHVIVSVVLAITFMLAIAYRRDHHVAERLISPVPAICRHIAARSGEGWASTAK